MADARELVGVLPLFEMRLSLAYGSLPRCKDGELTMRCRGGNERDIAPSEVPSPPKSAHRALWGATHLKIRVYRCLRCRTQFAEPYESANPLDANDHP